MDLDNLKKAAKDVRAPQIASSGTAASVGIDALVHAIQANDDREWKQTRKAFPFYLLAAVLYALGGVASIVGITSPVPSKAIHFGVLASIFLMLSVLMLRKQRSIRTLDYTKPVQSFLAETEGRYRFIGPVELLYSIPLLLVLAVTGGFYVVDALIPRRLTELQLKPLLAAYGLFFAVVCVLGYYFTYKNWRRDKGEIFTEVRRMRQELESQSE